MLEVLTTTKQWTREGDAAFYKGVVGWGRYTRARVAEGMVFHYAGPREEPAIFCNDVGQVLGGVNLWRSEYYPGVPLDVLPDGTIGPRPGSTGIYCIDPCSTLKLLDGSINGFDTGLHIAPTNHCESFTFDNYHFTANNVCILNDEHQAVGHELRQINIGAGCGIFWYSRRTPVDRVAGGLPSHIGSISLMNPATLFKTDGTSSNGSTMKIDYIKVDPNAGALKEIRTKDGSIQQAVREGWKLMHHAQGPLTIIAEGDMATGSMPAKDALVLNNTPYLGGTAPTNTKINKLQLTWRGEVWPEAFKWSDEAGEWIRR